MPELEAQLRSYSRQLTAAGPIALEVVIHGPVAPPGRVSRRVVLLAAVAAFILVVSAALVLAGPLGRDDGPVVTRPAPSSTLAPPSSSPPAEQWLLPPRQAADLDLVRVSVSSATGNGIAHPLVTFGASTYQAVLDFPHRTVTFQYGDASVEPPAANVADALIGVTQPVEIDASDVQTTATRVDLANGLTFFRLGEDCPPAGQYNTRLSGHNQRWPCELRAIVLGPDFLAEVSARDQVVLDALLAEMSGGSLDELRLAVADVDGADAL